MMKKRFLISLSLVWIATLLVAGGCDLLNEDDKQDTATAEPTPTIPLAPTATPTPPPPQPRLLLAPTETIGTGIVRTSAWSPDGNTVAAATSAGVLLIDIWRDELPPLLLADGEASVESVSFSADSTQVIAGHTDGTVRIWSLADRASLFAFTGHEGAVKRVVAHPDGSLVASGGTDGTVRIWSLAGDTAAQVLEKHDAPVQALVFSADGRWLASGDADGQIYLWSLESPDAAPRLLNGHTDAIRDLDFDPQSTQLASASADETVRLWNVEDGEETQVLEAAGGVFALDFSREGILAYGGEASTIKLWSASGDLSPSDLIGISQPVTTLTFNAEGTQVLALTRGTGQFASLIRWDVAFNEPLRIKDLPSAAILNTAPSLDGSVLIYEYGQNIVRLFAIAGRENLLTLPLGDTEITALAYGTDGQYMFIGDSSGILHYRDTLTGETAGELGEHDGALTALQIHPNGEQMVSGGADGTIKIWDIEVGVPDARVIAGLSAESAIVSLRYNADGSRLAAGDDEGRVYVWELSDRVGSIGDPEIYEGHSEAVTSLSFSPDGRRLASTGADGTVRLWNVTLGLGGILTRTDALYTYVTFSPDSSALLIGADNGTLTAWDFELNAVSFETAAHGAAITGIFFDPQTPGQVITTGEDGVLRFWTAERLVPRP